MARIQMIGLTMQPIGKAVDQTRDILKSRIVRILTLIGIGLALLPTLSQAQIVQRGTINMDFEQPQIANACQAYVYAARVPGWLTTQSPLTSPAADFRSPNGCVVNNGTNPPGGTRVFEFYSNGVFDHGSNLVLNANSGRQFVELNAHTRSRLYQNICVVPGEVINFSFAHLGRLSATVPDVARMMIGGSTLGSGQEVVRVATTTGGQSTRGITMGLSTNTVHTRGGPSSSTGGQKYWAVYSGSFVVPAGLSGNQQLAVEAVSSSDNKLDHGNFLDSINVYLQPYVEMANSTYTTTEGQTAPSIEFRVVGRVTAPTGMNVSFAITGGSASIGTDYTVNGGSSTTFSVSIPQGDYTAGQIFRIPVSIINDQIPEPTENFTVTLNDLADYVVTSTTTCGGSPIAKSTYTILDNDATVAIQKSTANGFGGSFSFTPTNLSAAINPISTTAADTPSPAVPAAVPVTSLNTAVTLTETLPAGWHFRSAVCTDVNAADTGNTPITLTTQPITIPAANVKAGAAFTCVITNTAMPDLAISKTNTPASGSSDLSSDTVNAGAATTYTVRVTNTGPGSVTGAVVRDSPISGLTCPPTNPVTCSGGSACPASQITISSLAAGVTLGTMAPGSALNFTFTCTVSP